MSVTQTILQTATTAKSVAGLITVSPQQTIGYQPLSQPVQNGAPQPNGKAFLFDYEGENVVALESDITDHFSEDNTSLQDQIALRPELITVHGFIGEVTDVPPNAFLAALETIASRLTSVPGLVPQLSLTAQQAYQQAFFAYQTAAAIANTVNNSGFVDGFSDTGVGNFFHLKSLNNQQTAFQTFYQYWRNRILFNVQTPWAVFQNCAIKTLRAIQDETTNTMTDFEVTFKVMRFASTTTQNFGQGRNNTMTAPAANQGTQTLTNPSPVTFSSAIQGQINQATTSLFGTLVGA